MTRSLRRVGRLLPPLTAFPHPVLFAVRAAVLPLKHSVTRTSDNSSYRYHVGLVYAGTRQFARARAASERALELDSFGAQDQEIRTAPAALPPEQQERQRSQGER